MSTCLQTDPYRYLRPGILQRINPLNEALSLLRDPGMLHTKCTATFRMSGWDDAQEKGKPFLEAVREDYQHKIDKWISRLKQQTNDLPLMPTPHLRISDALTVNAFIGWPQLAVRNAGSCLGLPEIVLHIGLILAVEDLLGQSLSNSSFFANNPQPGQLTVANPCFVIGTKHPCRCIDYGPLLYRQEKLARFHLTRCIPISPWRLYQLDLLAEVAVHWAFFHEQAHWLLGHLDFMAASQRNSKKQLKLQNTMSAPNFLELQSKESCQYFEITADALATSLLFHFYWPMKTESESFAAYRKKLMDSYDSFSLQSVLGLDDEISVLRTLMLAISVVLLLLEHQRTNYGQTGAYPLPATRLFGIYYTLGQAYADTVIPYSYKGAHRPEQVQTLTRAFVETSLDLQFAVSHLEVDNPVIHPFNWDRTGSAKDDFSDDLFDVLSGILTGPEHCRTAAAAGFLRSRNFDDHLAPLLKEFIHL
ncbi:MAG: hypothetical protein R2824_02165 [Saprospiraceae bacterium]|nr:hypothetical protein [Lewinella sp.]